MHPEAPQSTNGVMPALVAGIHAVTLRCVSECWECLF
jgi:hypothetical protein